MSRFLPSTPHPPQHVLIRLLSKFANGTKPNSPAFWREVAIVFTVFGVTGSSSMYLNKRVVQRVAGEGSWKEGPNTWRAAYLACGLPLYSITLLTLGTLSGRGAFFRSVLWRMYGRLVPVRWRQ